MSTFPDSRAGTDGETARAAGTARTVRTEPARRVVLVTGAAQRIGRALALGFAAQGWDVAVHYGSSRVEALATVADIHALGRRACALHADLAVEEAVAQLVPACTAE